MQSQSIGYEGIGDHLPPGHVFANAASVHETSTAELAVALTLASQRHLPTFVRAQDERRWAPEFSESLADRRVLLLGYGGVGKAVAARLAPVRGRADAWSRRARGSKTGCRCTASSELLELLPRGRDRDRDACPAARRPSHIIDAAALAALPDGALVVNVGRGPLIDTDALVADVERGRLRAALDVTDPEPLPADHPLWSAARLAHRRRTSAAHSSAMQPRAVRLIRTQIERMLAGEPPLNVVYES